MSLAGSFGYVAPEVLNHKGHGKPVDLWAIGYAYSLLVTCNTTRVLNRLPFSFSFGRIITYVLLCGYSPFRSDDLKELLRQTTEAKITFHDRYWNNVSEEGTSFPPRHCNRRVTPCLTPHLPHTQQRDSFAPCWTPIPPGDSRPSRRSLTRGSRPMRPRPNMTSRVSARTSTRAHAGATRSARPAPYHA